jgi:hypothetical protein
MTKLGFLLFKGSVTAAMLATTGFSRAITVQASLEPWVLWVWALRVYPVVFVENDYFCPRMSSLKCQPTSTRCSAFQHLGIPAWYAEQFKRDVFPSVLFAGLFK